jgi:transposase-like protein
MGQAQGNAMKRQDENAVYWRRLRGAEKQMLEAALQGHESVREAAKALGVSANYLSKRVVALKVTAPHGKPGPKGPVATHTWPIVNGLPDSTYRVRAARPGAPESANAVSVPPAVPSPLPGPSAFEHSYYGSITDSLVIILGLFARGVDSPVIADCRHVTDLVHRGICAPREAAGMLHRILMQVVYGKHKQQP